MSQTDLEQIGQKYLTTSKGTAELQYRNHRNLTITIWGLFSHCICAIDPPPFSSWTRNQIKAPTIPTPKAHKLRYPETKQHTLAKCPNVCQKTNYLHSSRSEEWSTHFCNIPEKNGMQNLPSMLGEQLTGHVCAFHAGIPDAWCGHKAWLWCPSLSQISTAQNTTPHVNRVPTWNRAPTWKACY